VAVPGGQGVSVLSGACRLHALQVFTRTLLRVWNDGKVDVGALDFAIHCLYGPVCEICVEHCLYLCLDGRQLAPALPQVVYLLPALYDFLCNLPARAVGSQISRACTQHAHLCSTHRAAQVARRRAGSAHAANLAYIVVYQVV